MPRVTLIHRAGRDYIEARWMDPITGRKRTRSTGTDDHRKALRVAVEIEAELDANTDLDVDRITWAEVRRRYEAEALPGLARGTARKTITALNALDALLSPKLAKSVTAGSLSTWISQLRRRKLSPHTIKGYSGEIVKVCKWAKRRGLLTRIPDIEAPQATPAARGRAISGEEFDRMIEAAAAVVGADQAKAWQHLLRILWFGGLRLSEALALHWSDSRQIVPHLDGAWPALAIPAAMQKSRRAELLPITPEFSGYLQATPSEKRRGWIVRLPCPRHHDLARPSSDWAGRVVSRIGAHARIETRPGQTATAHDLRRSFGNRLALAGLPLIHLQAMMRHASAATTQAYYLNVTAEATAAALANQFGNKSGNRDAARIANPPELIAAKPETATG